MQWERRSATGLGIYKPKTFKSLDTDLLTEEARAALHEEGIICVTSVVNKEMIQHMKKSIVGDFHGATVRYRMNEVLSNIPHRHPHAREISDNLAVLQRASLPPRQRAPLDGVLDKHRIPLSPSSQLCRVAPGVRHVFSRLYGVDQEDLCMAPDAIRIIFEQHVASGSSVKPLGQSPDQVMYRRLNGTWQPPHRHTAYEAYNKELKRRLGDSPVECGGVMGLITLTDFRSGQQAADGTMAVGPCLVAVPSCDVEMERVYTLGEKASTQKVRMESVRRYQPLTDNEIEQCMDAFACIEAPAGALILYRRDLPVAFNYGDPESAEPNPADPYKLAYAAVASTWIPRSAQLEHERDRAMELFRKKSKSTAMYEMRSLTRAQVRQKIRGWRLKRKKEEIQDDTDALNDIDESYCKTLKLQLSVI